MCQKSGVFAAHSLIVLGGDAQVRTDLPMGDIADLQRFNTVCAITVQHMERQIVAVALKTKVAGIDHIILFGILLPGDLGGKLFQRQACFHGSTLLTSSARWHHLEPDLRIDLTGRSRQLLGSAVFRCTLYHRCDLQQ